MITIIQFVTVSLSLQKRLQYCIYGQFNIASCCCQNSAYIEIRCREILIQLAVGKVCARDRNAMEHFSLTSFGDTFEGCNSSITRKGNQLRFLSSFFPVNFSILLYLILKQGVNYFLLVLENLPKVLVFRRTSQGGKERQSFRLHSCPRLTSK